MKFDIKDLEPMIELLREHHEQDAKGYFSERKVRLLLEKEWDNHKTLILVNKAMTAVLIFMIQPGHFSTQPNLQEVCFYSRSAGSGFRLLKEAQPWIDRWKDGVLYKTFPSSGSPETNKMLERLGMKQIAVVYSMGD